MATPPKKTPKRKKKKKKVAMVSAMPMSDNRSVNIKKAGNGYVVSSYTDSGEKTLIAKTKKEANGHVDKLLGS